MSVTAGAIALGAGIAASANFLQSRLSENSASNLNEVNRDFQREMYARQLADTERLYNQYNSPSALKRQYLEAGINPSLVGGSSPYHGSGVSAPSASAAPSTAMPDFSGIGAAGSTMGNALVQQANIGNQQSESLVNIGKFVKDAKDAGMSDGDINSIIAPFIKHTQGVNFKQSAWYNGLLLDNAAKDEQKVYLQFQNHLNDLYGVNKAAAELMKLRNEGSLFAEKVLSEQKGRQLSDEQIRTLVAEQAEKFANAYKLRKEGNKYVAEEWQIRQFTQWLSKSYEYKAWNDYFNYVENEADFVSNEKVRSTKHSNDAKNFKNWNYKVSPEYNPVFGTVKQIGDCAPTMFINSKASTSTSYSPRFYYGDSNNRIFNNAMH